MNLFLILPCVECANCATCNVDHHCDAECHDGPCVARVPVGERQGGGVTTTTQAAFPVPGEAPVPEFATERTMLDALHQRYSAVKFGARRWAVAEHVPCRPAFAPRIADFVAMDMWRTGGNYELHGHEVKVSRSDWLRELADPWKSEAFTPYVHRWWLVVPDASIVHPGELPEGWGMLALTRGRLRAARRAPFSDAEPMPQERLAALMRAVQKTAAGGAS